jgi:hypothetical protein
VEIGNTQGVLDGDLDPFITESLKQGVWVWAIQKIISKRTK